jgi:hypothetical protein
MVKLSLRIGDKLACRIEKSSALGRVGVVQAELTNGQVESWRNLDGSASSGKCGRLAIKVIIRPVGVVTIWIKATS